MATRWTSKHTGQKIDDTIDCVSNPNLFDNWYFGNLVDQRGGYVIPPGKPYMEGSTQVGTTDKYYTAIPFSTWYNITVNGVVYNVAASDVVRGYTGNWMYSFDRWRISPSSTVCISDGGLSVLADFQQAILSTALILGQKYTMSVLSTDGRLGQMTFTLQQDVDINYGFGFGFFVVFRDADKYWFRLYGTNEATYLAIKLELGTTQTLAHREGDKWVLNEIPDYGEQLRRCQRYSVHGVGPRCSGYAINGSDRATIFIPTPVTMRTIVSAEIVTTDNLVTSYGGIIPIKSFSPAATLPNGVVGNLQISSPVTQTCVVAASGFKCNLIADL